MFLCSACIFDITASFKAFSSTMLSLCGFQCPSGYHFVYSVDVNALNPPRPQRRRNILHFPFTNQSSTILLNRRREALQILSDMRLTVCHPDRDGFQLLKRTAGQHRRDDGSSFFSYSFGLVMACKLIVLPSNE